MINSINHFSFTVSNLEKSVKFYQTLLGLRLIDLSERDRAFSEKVTGIKSAHLNIAYLSGHNCSIELIQYLSPVGKKLDTASSNVGASHICFNVTNFMDFHARLKKAGVHFIGEPQKIPSGPNKGRLVIYLKDPDSNTLEFISVEVQMEESF